MEDASADIAARRAGRDASAVLAEVRAVAEGAAGAGAGAVAVAVAYKLVNAARGLEETADQMALASVLRDLGGRVFRGGDFPAAQQVYRAGLGVCAKDARLHGNVASCCLNMGDFAGCVQACDAALDVLELAAGEDDLTLVAKIRKRKIKALIKMEMWTKAREVLDLVPHGPDLGAIIEQLLMGEVTAAAREVERRDDGGGDDGSVGSDDMPALCGSDSEDDSLSELNGSSFDADSDSERSDSDGSVSALAPRDTNSDVDNVHEDEHGLIPGADDGGDDENDYRGSEECCGFGCECVGALATDPATVSAPAGFRAGFLNTTRTRASSVEATAASLAAEDDGPPALACVTDEDDVYADDDYESDEYDVNLEAGEFDGYDEDYFDMDDDDIDGDEDGYVSESHSRFGTVDDSDDASNEVRDSDGDFGTDSDTDMPGLAESESDGSGDGDGDCVLDHSNMPAMASDLENDDAPSRERSQPPAGDASSSLGGGNGRPSKKKDQSERKKRPIGMPEADDGYDSATTSYALKLPDLELTVDLETDEAHDPMCDEALLSIVGTNLFALAESVLGKSFFSPQRTIDFDRFFGAHIPKAGTKASRKKGKSTKRPQQCSLSCGNCWARRMWRARFPWTPSDEASSKSPTYFSSSSSAVPNGLSEKARSMFMATGGLGSGRELYVSLAGAIVHSFCYICLLQCEMSWRDEHMVSRVKDAQSALQNMLRDEIASSASNFSYVTHEVRIMLRNINEFIDSGNFTTSKAAWDTGYRASEVCKRVAEEMGSPKLSISASTMAGLPVTAPDKSDALYSNGYAWARVGRIDRDERLVFACLCQDTLCLEGYARNGRFLESVHQVFVECMRDGIALDGHKDRFARITRRCLFERAKYMELQAGDVKVSSGFSAEPSHAMTPVSKAALAVAAENMNAVLRSVSDDSVNVKDAVHLRAVTLYSEAFKRVPRSRLVMKRAKRYILLGKFTDAHQDLKKGKSLAEKISNSAMKFEVGAELRRLCCILYLHRMRSAHVAVKRLELADLAMQEIADAGILQSSLSKRTKARLKWLLAQVEPVVETAIAAADIEKRNHLEEAATFEPEPANLPAAVTIEKETSSSSFATACAGSKSSVVASSRDASASTDDGSEYVGDEMCSFASCNKPSRRILVKEEWAETQCECCIVVQYHKNCYRSHAKLASSGVCPKCGEYQIVGRPLFMTVKTVDEKRSKRVPVRQTRSTARQSRVAVTEKDVHASTPAAGPSSQSDKQAGPSSKAASSPASTVDEVTADRSKAPASGKNSSRNVTVPNSTSCSVCNKQFNGPKQYQMHMASQKHLQKAANARRLDEAGSSSVTASHSTNDQAYFSAAYVSPGGNFAAGASSVPSSHIPQFNLVRAIECVKTALRTFPNEEARLSELKLALDMSSWGVVDAGKYFDENWQGLRTFLAKQGRHFSKRQENFRDYDYHVKIAQPTSEDSAAATVSTRRANVLPTVSSPPPGLSADAASSPSWSASLPGSFAPSAHTAVAPAAVSPHANFPTLTDFYYPARTQFSGNSWNVEEPRRDPPQEFSFGSSSSVNAASFRPEDVEGYSVPGREVENPCVICFDRSATHRVAPCACAAAYCQSCITEWIDKGRKKGRGATCPTCTTVIDDVVTI